MHWLIASISNTLDVNLFYQPLIPEGVLTLDSEESKHCVRVLRKGVGDIIRITDGKGRFYNAKITTADPRACAFIIDETIQEAKKNYYIHIAISPTKNADRIEWFVEKSVELGIDKITLLDCDNTERSYIKTERLEKLAISAMKQSLKASIPTLSPLTKFSEFIGTVSEKQRFIAYVDTANPLHLKGAATAGNSYVVLIGPEGDFSAEELSTALSNRFIKVSLGTSRLRTETAGIAACHILNLIN